MKIALAMTEIQIHRSSRGIGSVLLMAFALGLMAGSELALICAELGL